MLAVKHSKYTLLSWLHNELLVNINFVHVSKLVCVELEIITCR